MTTGTKIIIRLVTESVDVLETEELLRNWLVKTGNCRCCTITNSFDYLLLLFEYFLKFPRKTCFFSRSVVILQRKFVGNQFDSGTLKCSVLQMQITEVFKCLRVVHDNSLFSLE